MSEYAMRFLFLFFTLLFTVIAPIHAQSVKTHIPPQAFQYFPTIVEESSRLTPDIYHPSFYGALIEHESCLNLKHKRCWNSTSELLNSREQGVGFFQLTRTWNPDGSQRFDTLSDLRKQYMSELRELSWLNVKQRPDLQIRSGILLTKNSLKVLRDIEDPLEKLYMVDTAHNMGIGRIAKDRRVCGLTKGCDPNKWKGNVELHCTASRAPMKIYGGRSPCDIGRHHSKDVIEIRMPKYSEAFRKVME